MKGINLSDIKEEEKGPSLNISGAGKRFAGLARMGLKMSK